MALHVTQIAWVFKWSMECLRGGKSLGGLEKAQIHIAASPQPTCSLPQGSSNS